MFLILPFPLDTYYCRGNLFLNDFYPSLFCCNLESMDNVAFTA